MRYLFALALAASCRSADPGSIDIVSVAPPATGADDIVSVAPSATGTSDRASQTTPRSPHARVACGATVCAVGQICCLRDERSEALPGVAPSAQARSEVDVTCENPGAGCDDASLSCLGDNCYGGAVHACDDDADCRSGSRCCGLVTSGHTFCSAVAGCAFQSGYVVDDNR